MNACELKQPSVDFSRKNKEFIRVDFEKEVLNTPVSKPNFVVLRWSSKTQNYARADSIKHSDSTRIPEDLVCKLIADLSKCSYLQVKKLEQAFWALSGLLVTMFLFGILSLLTYDSAFRVPFIWTSVVFLILTILAFVFIFILRRQLCRRRLEEVLDVLACHQKSVFQDLGAELCLSPHGSYIVIGFASLLHARHQRRVITLRQQKGIQP